MSRRKQLQQRWDLPDPDEIALSQEKDKFLERSIKAIRQGGLIPIIGGTIRNEHIFDMDTDQDIDIDDIASSQQDSHSNSEDDKTLDVDKLNITEELAWLWAKALVKYPLLDGYRIARVAQFHQLTKGSVAAKEEYLTFLKQGLLIEAGKLAEQEGDADEKAYISLLDKEKSNLSFSDIVVELDCPRFSNGKEDPLKILASLPIKIYLTTSYFDFLERELEAAGKQPRSRFCFWNEMKADKVAPHHQPKPDSDFELDVNKPLVYHLFGMEQYPESLVLSEDDFLDFLSVMEKDDTSQKGQHMIPTYLMTEISESSLLLLGYRLHDWDLRVMCRVLRHINKEKEKNIKNGTVIQIDLNNHPLVQNEAGAKKYLKRYVKQANLDIEIRDANELITSFKQEWLHYNQGGHLS